MALGLGGCRLLKSKQPTALGALASTSKSLVQMDRRWQSDKEAFGPTSECKAERGRILASPSAVLRRPLLRRNRRHAGDDQRLVGRIVLHPWDDV